MTPRTAKDLVDKMLRRQRDNTVLHAHVTAAMPSPADPPDQEDPKTITWVLPTIETDLGATAIEQHYLIGGDLILRDLALHETRQAFTTPLLADLSFTEPSTVWKFMPRWRPADGVRVELLARRNHLSLLNRSGG